ncbi:hypothetical protein N9Q35_02390 [Amylibacter sp.]|nr:hypothetical protein [Amylibacter sp.]
MFEELVKEITKELEVQESRGRARSGDAHNNFEYAVRFILGELWKASLSYPQGECLINLRSGYYSELPRYRDNNLTYRQIKAAFDGMINCRMIEITTAGHFSKERGEGWLTKFISTDTLLEKFEGLEGHPAFQIKPNLNKETIILRNKVDGRKVNVPYEDIRKTNLYRSNLKTINECFLGHWADLRIKNTEYTKLANRVSEDIDLSSRTLVRIFSNGSFEEGGRFYRGWWQNVPSEYRKFITIDEKVTTEYDFSQLSPHMLYFAYNKDMGQEDAYDRVLDGQHRKIVKQAFNAMVQSKTPLNSKPNKIDLDGLEMSWDDLRQQILDSHKPISHLFFTGVGNKLQFKDSCIAESVMLQFANQNQVALPIHDSFMMQEGYAGHLEEAMRRAFYDEFEADIPLKQEVITERIALFDEGGDPRIQEVTTDDKEHSQWYDRNTMWLYSRT